METIRIVHIIPSLGKAGAERLAVEICNSLSKVEYVDVKLIILTDWNDYPTLTKNLDVKFIDAQYIPSITGKPINNVAPLTNFFNSYKPHIIHIHRFEAEMTTRATAYYNAAYVTHCHFNTPEYKKFSLKSLLSKALFTDLFERAFILKHTKRAKNNSYITISKNTDKYFHTNLPGNLANKIVLMYNAINFSVFAKNALPEPPTEELRLISIGTLTANKNQQFLINALPFLKEKNINVKLTLLGYGIEQDNLLSLAASLGVAENVSAPGIVENVEDYLSNSHIYLHSAISEAFGLVMVEAMAAGLPVITLDGKGNRDVNVEGKTGYLLPADTKPEEFAEKIIFLASNPELYSEMSNYARSFAAGFDIENYTQKLLREYKKLL